MQRAYDDRWLYFDKIFQLRGQIASITEICVSPPRRDGCRNKFMSPQEKNDEPQSKDQGDKGRTRLVLAACLVSFVVIMVIDALTPVGVATGVLYIIPVGLTLVQEQTANIPCRRDI